MSEVSWWIPDSTQVDRVCHIEASCGLQIFHGHWRGQLFYDDLEVQAAFPDGLPKDENWKEVGAVGLAEIKRWLEAGPPTNTNQPSRQNLHQNHVHVAIETIVKHSQAVLADRTKKDQNQSIPSLTKLSHSPHIPKPHTFDINVKSSSRDDTVSQDLAFIRMPQTDGALDVTIQMPNGRRIVGNI